MEQVVIGVEPIELVVDGTTIVMQCDPSGGEAWARLMDLDTSYQTAKERDTLFHKLLEGLSQMAQDEENAAICVKAFDGLGILTLKRAAAAYVEAVTNFPTLPSASSNKR